MSSIYISSVINAPIGKVWAAVRDFNSMPSWHPAIADSLIEEEHHPDRIGCIRRFNLKTGGTIRERLLTLSDHDRACTYAILESPLPVRNYVATLRLRPVTDGDRTFAEWTADFDSDKAQEMFDVIGNAVFQTGLTALKERFGG